MKNVEYNRIKELVLNHHSIEELKANTKALDGDVEALVRNGEFAVYYDQIERDLQDIYGAEYDSTRYYNKNGSYKIKNGEIYIWTVYINKLTYAINKMIKEENE